MTSGVVLMTSGSTILVKKIVRAHTQFFRRIPGLHSGLGAFLRLQTSSYSCHSRILGTFWGVLEGSCVGGSNMISGFLASFGGNFGHCGVASIARALWLADGTESRGYNL